MQTDARLIQHVKHAGQTRTDLRGQTNALGFAAAQCPALAIEREVAKPDFDQKLEPASISRTTSVTI